MISMILNGFIALFLNFFSSVFICASEETQVSCVFNENCVLPCSFQSGSNPGIHWYKTPGDVPVHIFFYDQDQVQYQNQDFKGRTSLFVDQISRGNASLLLREVKVQDEGTYKCHTGTVTSEPKDSFINLRVKEIQVSCVFNESCVLPCSFQSDSDPVIHWYKTPGDVIVHIYYKGQDKVSFQNLTYKDRTSLFVDQISRGNASLLLREVKVQDEGTYKCFINTVNSVSKNSFINLRVRASVSFVNIEQRGDELICSSKDIYPKPDVSWSLRPPPPDVEPNTSVSVSEKGLYSIFSSVPPSHKPPEEHSCNISTDHSWSSATYRPQVHKIFSENKVTVPCSASNASIKSLIWKFNQTQTILTQTGTNRVYNNSWRQFVEEVSESGLTLKNLSSGHQGVYSCVLSSDRETLISSTHLKTQPETESDRKRLYIWLGVFFLLLVTVALLILSWKIQRCSYKSQRSHKSENRGATGECNISNQEDKLLKSTNIHPQEKQLPNAVMDLNTDNLQQQRCLKRSPIKE